jgi:hypothetical protein
VVSFTLRPLYPPGKEALVPIGYEVGWTPEPVWTIWRKFLTLSGLELRPLRRPARSQSLCRLRYPGLYLLTMVKTCKCKTFTSIKLATVAGLLVRVYIIRTWKDFQTLATCNAHSVIFLNWTVPILGRQSGLYTHKCF